MAPSESFDPRTWQGDTPAPLKAQATAREPAREPRVQSRWLGLALSAAILAGGAAAAYATRADAPAQTVAPAAS